MKRYRLSCWKFFQNTKSLQWLSPQSSRGVNSHVPFPQEINATERQNYSTEDTFILHVYVVLETFATSYCLFWCFNRFVKRNKRFKRKKYVLNLLLPVFNSLWRQCTSFPLKTLRIHGVCTGSSKTKLRWMASLKTHCHWQKLCAALSSKGWDKALVGCSRYCFHEPSSSLTQLQSRACRWLFSSGGCELRWRKRSDDATNANSFGNDFI